MPITDFETPESFRGRFEWTVEDDNGGICSRVMTSLTRRVHVRRQTAWRWCKLATALIMAVLFTQAIFYITGKSVVPYNPSQPMPGSIIMDQYQHGYDNDGKYDHLHEEADHLYNAAMEQANFGQDGDPGVPDLNFGSQEEVDVPRDLLGDLGPFQEEHPENEPGQFGFGDNMEGELRESQESQQQEYQSVQIDLNNPAPVQNQFPWEQQQQPEQQQLPGYQQPPFQQQAPQQQFGSQNQLYPAQQQYPQQQIAQQQYPQQQPLIYQQQQQLQQQQQQQPFIQQQQQYPQQPQQQYQVPAQPQNPLFPSQQGVAGQYPGQPVLSGQPQQQQQFQAPPPAQPIAGRPPFPQIQFNSNPSHVDSLPPSAQQDTLGALETGQVDTLLFPDEQKLASQQIERPAYLPGLNAGPQQSNFPPMTGGGVSQENALPASQLQLLDVPIGQVDVGQYEPQDHLNIDDPNKLLHDIGMEQPISQVVQALTPAPVVGMQQPADFVQSGVPMQVAAPVYSAQPASPVMGLQVNPPLDDGPDFYYGQFPNGFFWSVATSAYQIEGGYNADGKGPSIWDIFSHIPGRIEDGTTGDIACDSYHKYQEDVQMAKSLGVKHYRFSISWARLQPTGVEAVPNPLGVQYYNNLINALLAEGIQPAVTLYHWDLPQALEDRGGWLNESVIVTAFANYARHCYREFGDRVKFWVTLNEPFITANAGYGRGKKAPGLTGEGDLVYIAGHNLLKAHAQAYRLYQREFQATQKGFVGITLNIVYKIPKNPSNPLDVEAAERAMMFDLGWFANPVYGDGDYPEVMKRQVALKSQQQGLARSRLPEFTENEKKFIKGTSDFFGLNTYTTRMYEHYVQPVTNPSFGRDQDVRESSDPSWPTSGSPWLLVNPEGMRGLLNWVKNHYGLVPIYITENGISDRNGTLDDYHRVYYYKFYINNILKAINIDGVRVIGYTAWALMDNFEWEKGYAERFGLYHVDFNNPSRPRTPKASATYYSQIIANNGFPVSAK